MKKLKLYGEKKILGLFTKKEFIAEVFVKEGKVVVESENKKLRMELQKKLDELVEQDKLTILKGVYGKTSPGGYRDHKTIEVKQKPTDPYFLCCAVRYTEVWNTNRFAGYKISGSLSEMIV